MTQEEATKAELQSIRFWIEAVNIFQIAVMIAAQIYAASVINDVESLRGKDADKAVYARQSVAILITCYPFVLSLINYNFSRMAEFVRKMGGQWETYLASTNKAKTMLAIIGAHTPFFFLLYKIGTIAPGQFQGWCIIPFFAGWVLYFFSYRPKSFLLH